MLYLALKLFLPSGEVLSRYVVSVDNGIATGWSLFETECQSMIYVEELILSSNPNLTSFPVNDSSNELSAPLYVYKREQGGGVVRL